MKRFLLIFQLLFICFAQLANAQTGELLGVASIGGKTNGGVIFKINSDGTGFDTLYSFNKVNASIGFSPAGQLVPGDDGKWYGILGFSNTTSDSGVFYSFDLTTHNCKKLFAFNSHKGTPSFGSIVKATNGILYLATSSDSVGSILCYNTADNSRIRVLNFDTTDGRLPFGGLLYTKNGNLYGMTAYGGAYNDGELFCFNPLNKTYKKLYDFNKVNGLHPWGNLIEAKDGKLYGMTSGGGVNDTAMWNHGDGVIFSFNPADNSYKKLHDFKWKEGATPQSSLLQAKNGKLYGLTWYGGAYQHGVVFVFNPSDNSFTDIHDFNDSDGSYPHGSLILVKNNELYGMTTRGGTHNCGIIFLIDTKNNSIKKIYDFDRVKGGLPFGDLSEIK